MSADLDHPGGAASAGPPGPLWFDRGTPSRLDRMPVFGEAMAAAAVAWTRALAALAGAPAIFTFLGLDDCKVANLQDRRGPDPVFAVLDVPGWSTAVGLQFDRAFVSVVVETLFGGGDDEGAERPVGPLSAVEARIAEVVAAQAADALRAGFAEMLPSAFLFDRIQPKPDLVFLGRPNAAVIVATVGLKAAGQTVTIDLIVPRTALDAFAEALAVLPADEPSGSDPRWSEQLGGELARAPMSVAAVVELPVMTLGDIARLAVGQVLALPREAANQVRLICGGRDLFRCDFGQSGGHHTVRIGEAAPGLDDVGARQGFGAASL